MAAVAFILLAVLALLGYRWLKGKGIEITRNVLVTYLVFSVLIIGTSLGADSESNAFTQSDEEIEAHENLLEENNTLSQEIEDITEKLDQLQIDYDELKTEKDELVKSNKKLTEKIADAEKANEDTTDSDRLVSNDQTTKKDTDSTSPKTNEKKETASTTKDNTKPKQDTKNDTSTANNTPKTNTKNDEVKDSKNSTNDTSKSKEENKASVSSNNTDQTSPAQEGKSDADCQIKGSVNGIYHVPGSTYYNRTKNVAQWFCSTEEAEKAGYRAPKK